MEELVLIIALPSWSSHCQSTPRTTLAPGNIPLAVIFFPFLRASTSVGLHNQEREIYIFLDIKIQRQACTTFSAANLNLFLHHCEYWVLPPIQLCTQFILQIFKEVIFEAEISNSRFYII